MKKLEALFSSFGGILPQKKDVLIMCTAIVYKGRDTYFGRNLDLHFHYRESVTVTPRKYPFPWDSLYAIIGIATVQDNYPLYYDGVNEMGLAMAGLNFPGIAYYPPKCKGKDAIAPYEFIPWVLSRFSCAKEAVQAIRRIQIADIPFSQELPNTPLHFILCDKENCYTIEPTRKGIVIYENPVGVLTNSPDFPYHLYNLCNYQNLSSASAENRLSPSLSLLPYSNGMGAFGLPGDLSSASRFVKAAFTLQNALKKDEEASAVNQFFHILGAVYQQEGCVKVGNQWEKTVYTSCCNLDKGIYYYSTYDNTQLTAVHLYHEDLYGHKLISYPLCFTPQIRVEN